MKNKISLCGHILNIKHDIIAKICKIVFSFPREFAAITLPFELAINLIDVTKNSLDKMIITITTSISFKFKRQSKADITNILSARGSINFPKLVTKLYFLATFPSIASVIDATIKIIRAIVKQKLSF